MNKLEQLESKIRELVGGDVEEKWRDTFTGKDHYEITELQLQHVLIALGDRKEDLTITNLGHALVFRLTVGRWQPSQKIKFACWDLTKPLSQQDESVISFLSNLLGNE